MNPYLSPVVWRKQCLEEIRLNITQPLANAVTAVIDKYPDYIVGGSLSDAERHEINKKIHERVIRQNNDRAAENMGKQRGEWVEPKTPTECGLNAWLKLNGSRSAYHSTDHLIDERRKWFEEMSPHGSRV